MKKILIPSKNPAVLAAVQEALETLAERQTVFIERLAEIHHLDPEALGVVLETCIYGKEDNVPVFTVVNGAAGLAPPPPLAKNQRPVLCRSDLPQRLR
jgi:hypothetical protein